jgi:hypothetical protein
MVLFLSVPCAWIQEGREDGGEFMPTLRRPPEGPRLHGQGVAGLDVRGPGFRAPGLWRRAGPGGALEGVLAKDALVHARRIAPVVGQVAVVCRRYFPTSP